MRLYRIKQISEKEFIPQTRKWLGIIFTFWEGIERKDFRTWYGLTLQELYCKCSTFEEAKQVIEDCKKLNEDKRKYPKYHKVK
jgi:hypothetical protein